MASERLQKISGEAFNRLRSDHEQFLEAYESKLKRWVASLAKDPPLYRSVLVDSKRRFLFSARESSFAVKSRSVAR